MKDETQKWINFADENYQSAQILLHSHLYNPTLQNIQQAFEKYLKALFIENGIKLQKTHNILTLINTLNSHNIEILLDEDIIDLIDSIYITTKYPFGSVLADFEPNETLCKNLLDHLSNLRNDVKRLLK